MARICLLSPGHLSTNPRLVKEADALADAGHEVTLITGDYSLWAREADKTITARWRVVRTLCFGPQAALPTRIFQFLRVRAARVLMAAGFRDPAVVRAAWHPIAPDLVAAAKGVKADLYVAHYPAALPAAAIAGRVHKALYAFDAEDFHLGDPPDGIAYASERRMVRAIEERYLPGCVYVTAASPGIADAYVSLLPHRAADGRTQCLPPRSSPDAADLPRGRPNRTPQYTGSRRRSVPTAGLNARCARSAVRGRDRISTCVERPPQVFLIV